jgi:hypothetical protein
LLIRDDPKDRWVVFSTMDLVLAPKKAVSRRLDTGAGRDRRSGPVDRPFLVRNRTMAISGRAGAGRSREMSRVTLMTIDEARNAVARSAVDVASRCHTPHPFEVAAMLWGSGPQPTFDAHDQRLARRHRRVLDSMIEQGYHADICDELEGVASAFELDNGRLNRSVGLTTRLRWPT